MTTEPDDEFAPVVDFGNRYREVRLLEFLGTLSGRLPVGGAPFRFAQLLAEVVPDWRIEVFVEDDAPDVHFSAIAPDRSGGCVGVTVDLPSADGYRDVDEWTVSGYGPHQVTVEMKLPHGAGRREFDVALRLLRATWADPQTPDPEQPGPGEG